jgi:hypothetical protein
MTDIPYVTQAVAEVSAASEAGSRVSQAVLEASATTSAATRTTSVSMDITTAVKTAPRMTRTAAEMSATGAFATRMTQAALTASSSGAFRTRATLLCVEVSVTHPGTERVSGPVRFFSTGALYAVSGGTRIELALLQNVTVDFKAEAKRLYDCLFQSALPIDVGYADGAAALKAEMASLSPDGVTQLLGGSLADLTAYQVLTLARDISKLPFQAVLTAVDTLGRQHQWTFGNVFCPTLMLPVTARDFLKPQFAMDALPDPNGIVAMVALAE